MKEKLKKQKGITLVALVITIIVLLILAMVSISIVMNQGIMTKSKIAADKHQIAAEKEAINIGYSEYLNDKYSGTTPLELKVADANVQENANEWTITFNAEPKNVYKLSKDGGEPDGPLTGDNAGGNEGTLTDEEMQVALQSFTANPQNYVHPEQSSTNKDRAIGTDGKAVNMNLWEYTILNEDNKEIMLATDVYGCAEGHGYLNSNIVDGKIQGTVPQYIYVEEKNQIYTVTSMRATFSECKNLVQAPILPTTVTDMQGTFYYCTNLTKAPKIPNGVTNLYWTFINCALTQAPEIPSTVTNMGRTFSSCKSLTQAPVIPSSVTNMDYTFNDCISLTQAPAIPNSVTTMYETFKDCTSLTQAPAIPSSVTNMWGTFSGCTSLTQAPTIPSSVTDMGATFKDCTSLTQAPEIPSSVTNMDSTFLGCTSLTGTVRINASNINYASGCFNNITNNITVQVPENSTTYNTFNSSYGSSSNITIETF